MIERAIALKASLAIDVSVISTLQSAVTALNHECTHTAQSSEYLLDARWAHIAPRTATRHDLPTCTMVLAAQSERHVAACSRFERTRAGGDSEQPNTVVQNPTGARPRVSLV